MQILGAPCVALTQNAQALGGIFINLVVRPLPGYLQVFIAQECHAILLQPVDKRQCLAAALVILACIGADRITRQLQALTHCRKVVDHQGDFPQDIPQGIMQFTQLIGARVTADFEEQQAFMGNPGRIVGHGTEHCLQFAARITSDQQVAARQGMNADVALVQLPAHGRRAKRQVPTEDGDYRAFAFPAVVLQGRVEDTYLGFWRVPVGHKVKQDVKRAVEVINGSVPQILRGVAGKEILCEFVQGGAIILSGLRVNARR